MICYSKTASDTKHRVRDLAWLHGRFFAIAAICVAPVCVYFFLAGIISYDIGGSLTGDLLYFVFKT